MELLKNGIKLTEEEARELVWQNEVDTEYGENRRWSRAVSTVVQVENRYFIIDWEEGLTESQPNEFYEGEYPEVFKHEKLNVEVQTVWSLNEQNETPNIIEIFDETQLEEYMKIIDVNKVLHELEKLKDLMNELDLLNVTKHMQATKLATDEHVDSLAALLRTIKGG